MNRLQLKNFLFKYTHCDLQHDGWPCGTCFAVLPLKVGEDRQNELWQSVLAFRGDYSPIDVEQSPEVIKANIEELYNIISRP